MTYKQGWETLVFYSLEIYDYIEEKVTSFLSETLFVYNKLYRQREQHPQIASINNMMQQKFHLYRYNLILAIPFYVEFTSIFCNLKAQLQNEFNGFN